MKATDKDFNTLPPATATASVPYYPSSSAKSIVSISSSISSGLPSSFSQIKPIVPAVNDASKIAIFALFVICESVNARFVIKIDIVKPMPPRTPAPMMCLRSEERRVGKEC